MSASDYISGGLQAYAGYELADEGILSAEQAAINAKLEGDALENRVMGTAEFQPYSVVSSTGSTVNVGEGGGINVNLSPREQSIQDSALFKTETTASQLGTDPSATGLGATSTNAFIAANQPNALTGAGQGALLSTGPSALATSGEQAYRNLSDDPLSQMATDQYGNLQPSYLTTKSQGEFDTLGRDARTQGLLSQSDNYFNTAAMSPSQAQAYLYEQLRAVQRPEEQRQRLALEERMMSQGRLGFSSSVYGGASPELLAQAKAIEEARASANLTARQQAMKESQQAFDRGTGLLTSTNEMRAQDLKEAAGMFEAGTTRDKLALDTASSLADTGLAREKLDTTKAESMFEAGMTQERQDVDRAGTVFEAGLTQEESDMLNAARLQDAGFAITDQQIENLNTTADIAYRPQEEALAATGYGIDASNIATRAGSNAAQYQTDIGTATMESVMQAEQLQADLKRQQMTNLVSTLFQGGTNADGTPMDSMVDSTVDTILDWVFGDDDEPSAWNVGDEDYFTEGSGGGGEYEASEAELDAASNF